MLVAAVKPALSSKRLTTWPVRSTSSAIWVPAGGAGAAARPAARSEERRGGSDWSSDVCSSDLGGEAGLVFEAVDDLAGAEHQFGDLGSGGRGRCGRAARGWAEAAHAARPAPAAGPHGLGAEADAEELGGNRRKRDGAGAGGDGYRGLKVLAVVARFELRAARSAAATAATAAATGRQGESANGLWRSELELDPGLLLHRSSRQEGGRGQVAIGQGGERELATAGSHFRLQLRHGDVAVRHAVGDYGAIGIEFRRGWRRRAGAGPAPGHGGDVLELPRGGRRFGQRARERLSTLHAGFAPNEFLHGLCGRHPRSAALAPP